MLSKAVESDLLPAFKIDARNILRHPVFWSPTTCIGFIQKLGELLQSEYIKGISQGRVKTFKDLINESGVTAWKMQLFNDCKNLQELDELLARVKGVKEKVSVDFCIGIRHLTIHYPSISVENQ
ncbi:hypothetical protein MKX03_008575, partial [Papaver bracteatum]